MKKLLIVLTGLMAVAVINAQSLDEIVKKYNDANKQDVLAKVKSIKVTGKISAMGMELPLVMVMKNPDKIKMTYSFNGQEMVMAFDGEKGYAINPMAGSTDPVEITGDQLKQVQDNNAFKNQVAEYYKTGKLTLEGEDKVNDKPAFKLKASVGTTPVVLYIDKESYMLVKTTATVDNMGTTVTMDSFMSDFTDVQGVIMPKKITQMAGGMEAAVISFDTVEVNIPIEDSVFKIK
jgi:outer membrane lipoprotein-sorting protein